MKIAPRLQECVKAMPDWEREGKAGAELRALLAVARAAANGHGPAGGRCPLCRALARLEKVSGRKP